MRAVLQQEEEFTGWLEEVRFGIHDKEVCEVFREVFGDDRALVDKQGGRRRSSDWNGTVDHGGMYCSVLLFICLVFG